MKRKYYVVWRGREPGIYSTWSDCQLQTLGYENALFKAFETQEAAEKAYKENPLKHIRKKTANKQVVKDVEKSPQLPDRESIAVDAACSGNPGELEYRGVDLSTGEVLFHQGPFPEGTVNIGEFLAIVHGIALLQKSGDTRPVYSDSKTAIKWVRDKAANTRLVKSEANVKLFKLIDRAEKWLRENKYTNEVRKWDTTHWGEIPADFGRK